MDGTYRRLAAATLTAHQRRDDSNCLCGTLRLGESWSEHVAAILDLAGALRSSPPVAGQSRGGRVMDADLTCGTCQGTGACSHTRCRETQTTSHGCFRCQGTGLRPPTLAEWDALRTERDRYREALAGLVDAVEDELGYATEVMAARAALGDHDAKEGTA